MPRTLDVSDLELTNENLEAITRRRGTRKTPTKKWVLTVDEMRELETLMKNVFRYIDELRGKNKLAKWIQYPKTPSILSESAVIRLGPKQFPHSSSAVLGGGADVLLKTSHGEKKVEVKATGEEGFQAFSQKDVSADYLVWVHLGTFFKNGGEVKLYSLPNPGDVFDRTQKLDINKFRKKVEKREVVTLSGKSLSDIVEKYECPLADLP